MADVPVKIFRSRKTLVGVSPSIPSGVEGEPLPPVNPPGSNPSGGSGNDLNAVHYNLADGKNATERLQARDNLGSTSATPQVIPTAGAINNLVVTSNHLVFTGANVVLSGIVAGLNGEEITILNVSGTNLTLLLQSVLSTLENRFNGSVVIPNLSILRIKYRTTTNRWFFENVGVNDARYLRKDIRDGVAANQGSSLAVLFLRNTSGGFLLDFQNSAGVRIAYFDGTARLIGKGFSHEANANTIVGKNIGNTGVLQLKSLFDGSGTRIFNCINASNVEIFSCRGGEGNLGIRSLSSNGLINRSEQRLFYLVTIATTGAINNQPLTAGIFNYRFTLATSITGFNSGEIGLSIIIQNQTGATLTLVNESASSVEANRIRLIGASNLVIPIDGKVTLIYCTGNRWELLETNFNGLSTNGFKANGVRTQTGFFDPNISGITPVSIFQTPFSWIASYFSVGTVIEIDLAGTFISVNGDLLFNLIIGESIYFDLAVLPGPDTNTFRLQYKITISESNEIKIVSTVTLSNGFTTSQFQSATKNMNANFDIYIQARFVNVPANSNDENNVKSNLIEVKVH